MNSFNGPPGYLKNFYPPIGWTTIGLKVWGKYDNGDNSQLGTSNVPGEWYIGYHGIKTKNSIYGILTNGFIKGSNQSFANYKNINPLSYFIIFVKKVHILLPRLMRRGLIQILLNIINII